MLPMDALTDRLTTMRPHLDERQWRLLLGSEAAAWGAGGVAAVTRASGASRTTVIHGKAEIAAGAVPDDRIRRPGGGRPKTEDAQPGIAEALEGLVAAGSRGDPMSPLRWTTMSLTNLVKALRFQGFTVSTFTVARLLKAAGYRLLSNAKSLSGSQHPDRDSQFRYLNVHVEEYLAADQPVVSLDCKKKELVGRYANAGREWAPTGCPIEVDSHDFPDPKVPKAIPYGIYDVGDNTGYVAVGIDNETAAFAVATLRAWWNSTGKHRYAHADRLLITADAGGSNGYRRRTWKSELAAFAAETGLTITVCHFPPGTSKWNRIEHRLFSAITMNWRGRPLTSYQLIVDLIGATTNAGGLTVQAHLDFGTYPTGIAVTKQQMDAIPLTGHDWHGEWNYTIDAL